MKKNTFLEEIYEQPEAILRVIEKFSLAREEVENLVKDFQSGRFTKIVMTGMGSSYYCAYPSSIRLIRRGIPTFNVVTSELINYYPNLVDKSTLLVLISQSGESIETKRVLDRCKHSGLTISITTNMNNSLSNKSDLAIETGAGYEEAVSSKTYTSTLAMLYLIDSCFLKEDTGQSISNLEKVSKLISQNLDKWRVSVNSIVEQMAKIEQMVFIGRGPSYATAQTASLITLEASKLYTTCFSGGQFRHGPMEIVRKGFNSVIFNGDSITQELNKKLAQDICQLGGLVIYLSPNREKVTNNMHIIEIPEVEQELLPVIEIIPIQLMTIPLAIRNGFTPATFEVCKKVTREE